MLTFIDLFAGLGGASQAAKDRGWRVIRVDNNRALCPDIVADLRAPIPLKPVKVNVLWCSPPCIEFAQIALPWLKHPTNEPDLTLVRAAFAAREYFQPDWFILENTIHSRKWITPIAGPVFSIIAGHVFWGKLPCLLPDVRRKSKQSLFPCANRAALRACIPYEIGDAICAAVERQ